MTDVSYCLHVLWLLKYNAGHYVSNHWWMLKNYEKNMHPQGFKPKKYSITDQRSPTLTTTWAGKIQD